MRTLLALGLLITVPLVGCIGDSSDEDLATSSTAVADLLDANLELMESGGFSLDVPVDVYVIGFEPGFGAALDAALEPEVVDHSPFSFSRTFPPDPNNPELPLSGAAYPAPTIPRAIFRVQQVDAAFADAFFAFAASHKAPDSDALDANAAEDHLAQTLPAAGLALDARFPAFVILHGGDALGEHAWRYTYPQGYLEPVRAFGERYPFVVYDVSATPDPYVVGTEPSGIGLVFATLFGPTAVKEYNYPMDASGDATLDLVHELVIDATHYRLLKGPIYPVTTRPCHHVTLLLAVHQTALTEVLPGYKRAEEFVNLPGLESGWENLTGDDVMVELKVLTLPQDEPALDALARGAGGFATLDALRWYLDENWESFVTITEPCEEYLSLLLFGDAAVQGAFGGIGTYDVERSHRISFSLVNDVGRIRKGYSGPGEEILSTRNPRDNWDVVNLLYAHETGHLFGMHHPQHLSKTSGASPANDAFQSVWSVMSYETGTRTIDFGDVDTAQWQRARVGYDIVDARALGLEADPAFAKALDHLTKFEWAAAHQALAPHLIEGAEHAEHGVLPDYHVGDRHAHPWG